MKIFRTVQRFYVTLGISVPNPTTHGRVCFGFLLFGCTVASEVGYIFHVANDFVEYVGCICTTSGSSTIFVCLATIVFKRNLLFEFFDKIEQLIDQSETFTDQNALN